MRARGSFGVVSGARAFAVAGVIACSLAAVACGWIVGLGDPHPAPDAGIDAAGICVDRTPDDDGAFVAPFDAGAFTTICPGDGSVTVQSQCTKSAPCASIAEAICAVAADA